MADYKLRCADCGALFKEDAYYIGCPKCEGFLEVEFDWIPDRIQDPAFSSIFKYHPVMPYDPVHENITAFENYEDTPIIPSQAVANDLGIDLFYKDETLMPSGTWKDSEGFVSIHRLLIGNIKDLFVFSSGNTGTSLARSASIVKGPRLHLVIPSASQRRLQTYQQFFDPEFVKIHYFDGSNDECIVEARRLAHEYGYQVEGGFANYARREGLKLFALSVMHQGFEPIDWYVQAVAGGIGIYSYHKVYRDLGRSGDCPRLLGVQADICAPMVNAWKAGAETLEEKYIPQSVVPSEFVRVLRTRRPTDSYPILKPIMDQVGGRFEAVTEQEICEALRLFYREPYFRDAYRHENRLMGLEPATALAGILKGVREGYIEKGQRVLLNVSGGAKDGDIRLEWISDLL